MNSEAPQPTAAPTLNTANVMAGAIRFLHAVRVRRGTLLAALLISTALGAAYYATATRMYDAHAQVSIVQSEKDNSDLQGQSSNSGSNSVFQYMATYQRIMVCDRVLRSALKDLPKEYRVDFVGLPPETWPTALKNNLSVTNERGTTLIDVRFRSRDPKAAAFVVERIVN